MNPKPSIEQTNIIKEFSENESNIRVITPAGGGKTTLALLCIKHIKGARNVLFLTYNERLKKEIREKVREWKLENTEAHNFHAFACKVYKKSIYTDILLKKELDAKSPFYRTRFDVLIVDEAQDINELYYKFIKKIIKSCKVKQLMLIGDPRQSIFSFNGANPDFLIEPEKYFNCDFKYFEKFDTYRTNKHMTNFLNHSFLKNGNVISHQKNNNEKVDYWITNIYKSDKIIYDYIQKYGIDDIFILALSIKPNSKQPLIKVINKMKCKYGNKLNFFIADDSSKSDKDIVKNNKVQCLTFHKSKGLERKCVIVFGFDDSYDKYYNNENKYRPNPLYVALTRSFEKLVILCSRESKCYKTVNYSKNKDDLNILPRYIHTKTVENHFKNSFFNKTCPFHKYNAILKTVTDVIKYLDVNTTEKIIKMAKIERICNNTHSYNCKNNKIVTFKNKISEDMSPYYGTIMTLLLAKRKGILDLSKFIDSFLDQFKFIDQIREEHKLTSSDSITEKLIKNDLQIISDMSKSESECECEEKDVNKLLYEASICIEGLNGYSHKYYQILKNDSIGKLFDAKFTNLCLDDLSSEIKEDVLSIEDNLSKTIKYECPKCHDDISVTIYGKTDIITKKNVYEIKTKNGELDETSILQSIIYSSILNLPIILYNVQSGEKIKITGSNNIFMEFIKLKFFTVKNEIGNIEDDEEEEENDEGINEEEYLGYLDFI